MERRFAVAIGALLGLVLVVVPAGATAQSETVADLRIDVPVPDTVSGDLAKYTRSELAKRVAERVRVRLDAAGIKYQNVRTTDDSTVAIEANSDVDPGTLRGVALPPGEFELRPIEKVGTRWQELLGEMPSGVELRQGEDTLDREDAHLWAASRGTLEDFVEKVSLAEGDVLVYSTGDGWRTVTLGESLLNHTNVEASEIRTVNTGAPFVSVTVDGDGKRALNAEKRVGDGMYAAVLDGEVVALVEGSALTGDTLSLSAPDHLSGEDSLKRWARQVAGRLAAPIPLHLMAQ